METEAPSGACCTAILLDAALAGDTRRMTLGFVAPALKEGFLRLLRFKRA